MHVNHFFVPEQLMQLTNERQGLKTRCTCNSVCLCPMLLQLVSSLSIKLTGLFACIAIENNIVFTCSLHHYPSTITIFYHSQCFTWRSCALPIHMQLVIMYTLHRPGTRILSVCGVCGHVNSWLVSYTQSQCTFESFCSVLQSEPLSVSQPTLSSRFSFSLISQQIFALLGFPFSILLFPGKISNPEKSRIRSM